jgi:hypothetical protein
MFSLHAQDPVCHLSSSCHMDTDFYTSVTCVLPPFQDFCYLGFALSSRVHSSNCSFSLCFQQYSLVCSVPWRGGDHNPILEAPLPNTCSYSQHEVLSRLVLPRRVYISL